jgi:hypothetical protein
MHLNTTQDFSSVDKRVDKTGRAVLWFSAPCTARGSLQNLPWVEAFSHTSVDISFDVVNALRMPSLEMHDQTVQFREW